MQVNPDPVTKRHRGGGGRRGVGAVTVGVLLAWLVGVGLATPPAAAYPSSSVIIQGHGFGHGHGMGQWGTLGFRSSPDALPLNLGAYYGGTSLATLPAPQEAHVVTVAMTENDGNNLIVASATGFTVAGVYFPPGQVALMTQVPGPAWAVWTSSSCAGNPDGTWTNVVASTTDPTATPSPDDGSETLTLCLGGAANVTMHGSILATYNSLQQARTVNEVPLEQYVAGVVPNESPAGWGSLGAAGPQGQAWGFQELEAQAVATRSYVMASPNSYGGYADTSDLACQTYRGTLNESAVTDLATSATGGQVIEFPGGVVAATQYSASTGGYTNPGVFPAVPDAGDSVCVPGACNPNHDWTTAVPVETIDATWPQLGDLRSISITGRNGYGDLGGRVTTMTLVGSNQDVSLTGDAFAAGVGLRSDWFTTATALDSPAVAMARSPDGRGYWLFGGDGGVFTFGDARYLGSAGGRRSTGRSSAWRPPPTAGATGWWPPTAASSPSATPGFYGSTGAHAPQPAHRRHGRHPRRRGLLAGRLRRRHLHLRRRRLLRLDGRHPPQPAVVGMAPTPDGRGYWLVASDGGIFTFGDAGFYGSTGNIHLNQPIVGMAATPDGRGLLAGRLRRRHLHLRRRRLLRLDRQPRPEPSRSSAWPPPPTEAATGWSPPTAASSPSATPASTAREPGSRGSVEPGAGPEATRRGVGWSTAGTDDRPRGTTP